MFASQLNAQTLLNFYGFVENNFNKGFRLNSMESNSSNNSLIDDWEMSVVFSGYNGSYFSTDLTAISLSKKLDNHYLYSRYSPGISQKFIFKDAIIILGQDSATYSAQPLSTLNYSELFGLGYGYKFSDKFSAGVNLRYVQQEFIQQFPVSIITDSINYFSLEEKIGNYNFWVGDLGLFFLVNDYLKLRLESRNLVVIKEFDVYGEDDYEFRIRDEKSFLINLILENKFFSLSTDYLSNGIFSLGLNKGFKYSNYSITFGIKAFYKEYYSRFPESISPSLNFSSEMISVTISGIKYFSENLVNSLDSFKEEGIDNLIDNKFSNDRLFASVNLALSFKETPVIEFIDILKIEPIFPALKEKYYNEPFAIGKVVNISDKILTVQPSCKIESITEGSIYSPSVQIKPQDTAEIPFFIMFQNIKSKSVPEITNADFFTKVSESNFTEHIRKPVLVAGKNGWDGKVSTLSFFVRINFDKTLNIARQIISTYQDSLKNIQPELENFKKAQLLFNEFSKRMNYVADPRANTERVQFPDETFKLKGGDCDDLSVAYSALLESIGIGTAFIDYRNNNEINHVALLVNTELSPNNFSLITNNEKKIFIRESSTGNQQVWIPIETTELSDFIKAWEIGSEQFYEKAILNYGLIKGNVFIQDIY